VVHLGGAEFIQTKLEPFGEHGRRWAEEYAKFMGISIPDAVGQMELAALSHGHFNVVEAIREAASVQDVKSPKGLWKHLLAEQSKHGRREMPKQAAESPVRILSMAERSFR
jgi:predicted PhzF superfamily epimerase YddE/YHI9